MNVWRRLFYWVLALLLLALPLAAVFQGWLAAERWPFTRLDVRGPLLRVSADQVRAALLPVLDRGFFALDLGQVRSAVEALPWVASAQVSRRWPDTLAVRVQEHEPVAHWNQTRWLSRAGVVFAAPARPELVSLPSLFGADAHATQVAALHRYAETVLQPIGVGVAETRLSSRGSWSVVLGDGVRVQLGREQPRARLRRLARALPLIRADLGVTPLRFDLRYSNGIAVTPAPGGTGNTDGAGI